MNRTRREKNPDLTCGFSWGGTPGLEPMDFGWSCPHVCHEKVANHGDWHVCCNHKIPVNEEKN